MIPLKPNRDLHYLSECFDPGHLVPVIDGPWKRADAADALRHFGIANHRGNIVITID